LLNWEGSDKTHTTGAGSIDANDKWFSVTYAYTTNSATSSSLESFLNGASTGAATAITTTAELTDVLTNYSFFIGCSYDKGTIASFTGNIFSLEMIYNTAWDAYSAYLNHYDCRL